MLKIIIFSFHTADVFCPVVCFIESFHLSNFNDIILYYHFSCHYLEFSARQSCILLCFRSSLELNLVGYQLSFEIQLKVFQIVVVLYSPVAVSTSIYQDLVFVNTKAIISRSLLSFFLLLVKKQVICFLCLHDIQFLYCTCVRVPHFES